MKLKFFKILELHVYPPVMDLKIHYFNGKKITDEDVLQAGEETQKFRRSRPYWKVICRFFNT